MKFKKYSEIENSYRQKYIDYIYEQALNSGDDWVVTEKIHGSNFQLACDGNRVVPGKRGGIIGESSFFNWETIYDKYHEGVREIYEMIKKDVITLEQVTIFGELYGGIYPHDQVKPTPNASKVQKGIYYCPHNDMMTFDIYVHFIHDSEVKGVWLKYTDVINLCTATGLMALNPLFIGKLEDALNYSNSFESTIHEYHGLPAIEDNVCEGIVIKPNVPKHFGNGERVIIKNKNDKWSEKKSLPKTPKVPDVLSDDMIKHIHGLKELVTENRLKNLLSKFGPVTQKEFGKLMSGMMSDIMSEYLKDAEGYNELGKADQKRISKQVTMEIAQLIRPNFVNIIDGTY